MKSRLLELDVIRGYAIFGILVCNIVLFGYPLEYLGPYFGSHNAWYDQLATYIRFNFFGDKTFTLFSLLFGVGIGMQYVKRQAASESFVPHQISRMGLLFIIGLIHMLLIWYGDILALYALLGTVVLLFIRLPSQQMLGLAAVFFVWPTLQNILVRNGIMQIGGQLGEVLSLDTLINQNKSEGIQGHLKYNFSQVPGTLQFYLTGTLYYSMSMMLVGIAFVKQGSHLRIRQHLRAFKKLLLVTGLMVLAWNIYQLFFFDPNAMGSSTNFYVYWFFFQLSIPGQTFLVVALLVLILNGRSKWLRKVSILEYLGRLSLTNYLLHSLLGIILFKLLGFYGQSTPALDMLMTIVFTLGQILFSKWWVRKYGMGPMEKLWRNATSRISQ